MKKSLKFFLRLFTIEIFNYDKIILQSKKDIEIFRKKQNLIIIFINKIIGIFSKNYFLLKINPIDAENLQHYLYEKKPNFISNNFSRDFAHDAVIVSGFGSSGSGLIIDYLSQYNSFINPKIKKEGPFEFRFIKDPGGLLDFRDSILRSNYYWNNQFCIDNFLNQVNITARLTKRNFITKLFWDYDDGTKIGFSLDKNTNYKFTILTKKLIDDLISVKCKFKWFNNCKQHDFFLELLYNIIDKFNFKRDYNLVLFKEITPEVLDNKIKNYLNELFLEMIMYNLEYYYWHNKDLNNIKKFSLILDQGVAPYEAKKTMNILPKNSKVIIVYRDPRDIYVSSGGDFFPSDPEAFCKIYLSEVEKSMSQKNDNILHLQYENFVFQNQKEINKLEMFLNIDKSYAKIDQKKLLRSNYNLDWSRSRIGKWKNKKNIRKEIDYISSKLEKFCYQ